MGNTVENESKKNGSSLAELSLAALLQGDQSEDVFLDEPVHNELSENDTNQISELDVISAKDGILEVETSNEVQSVVDVDTSHDTESVSHESDAEAPSNVDSIQQQLTTDEPNSTEVVDSLSDPALLNSSSSNLASDDQGEISDLDYALRQSSALIDFLNLGNIQSLEEEIEGSRDETITQEKSHRKVSPSEQIETQKPLEPKLNVIHDPEAEMMSYSAKGNNTETELNEPSTPDENHTGFAKDSLTIEQDNPKIPPDLLTRRYKMDVVYTFGLPSLEGISLKQFQINSPEQCVDIQLKNGVMIKDYGKGFSLNGDDETCLGLAAIKMAKMKGWKCIKASGDPAYLTELENLCKQHGLGLRRSDVDYGRILKRVDSAINAQSQSKPSPSLAQATDNKVAPKASNEAPKASTAKEEVPVEFDFPKHTF